jgi:hypothetical protein
MTCAACTALSVAKKPLAAAHLLLTCPSQLCLSSVKYAPIMCAQVFDADMVCNKNFFVDILAVMTDPTIALCLSPQAFDNINQDRDIFNNINLQFWEYWLPGAAAWGYIACTGTNFAIRIKPLAHVGWFPTYTITEDYALGYELKKLGYKGAYLLKYIAVGEAPDEIRNVFRQRSRWTKGHMQVGAGLWAVLAAKWGMWRLHLAMRPPQHAAQRQQVRDEVSWRPHVCTHVELPAATLCLQALLSRPHTPKQAVAC